ncbi:MAG: DUF6036 family nucleotidyltransferase [Sediminibacterium sp.]
MANIFNNDFRDFISALNNQTVKYILVGGYSVILHGYPRTTGDMDIWVERTAENYQKIKNAFHEFGMPVFDMTLDNFLSHPNWDVFTFGTPPVSIDLMVQVEGLDFALAYEKSIYFEDDGLSIRTVHKTDLIQTKQIVNRPKDQDDLLNLI